MPDEAVTGFFGKIPAAGDFVTWNLPRVFTDRFDRWMAMDLRDRPADGALDPRAWRFTLPGGIFGPDAVAGVWRMSEDRAGRRYPLVIARLGPPPAPDDPWFEPIQAILASAVEQRFPAWRLAETLPGVPAPETTLGSVPLRFWADEKTVKEFVFADIYDLADHALPAMRSLPAETEEPDP